MIETILVAAAVATTLLGPVPILADELIAIDMNRKGSRYETLRSKFTRYFRGKPLSQTTEYAAESLLKFREEENVASFLESLYTIAALQDLEVTRATIAADPTLKNLPQEPVLPARCLRGHTKRRRRDLISNMAAEAKQKFPLIRKSEANYLVVRRFIYDRLKEHGVRVSHIKTVLPLAIELAFVPDESEIEAIQFAASAQVNLMHERYEEKWTNKSGILSMFQWKTYRRTGRGFSVG